MKDGPGDRAGGWAVRHLRFVHVTPRPPPRLQYLAQCGHVELQMSPWEAQCRDVRYKQKKVMQFRKSVHEHQRYFFISPSTQGAHGRISATVVTDVTGPEDASADGPFTFSAAPAPAEAPAEPCHCVVHVSAHSPEVCGRPQRNGGRNVGRGYAVLRWDDLAMSRSVVLSDAAEANTR